MTTAVLNQEGYLEIFSSVLLETIYLVRNKAVKVPDSSLVKYQLSEIPALRGLSGEELELMHFAKKELGGVIVG